MAVVSFFRGLDHLGCEKEYGPGGSREVCQVGLDWRRCGHRCQLDPGRLTPSGAAAPETLRKKLGCSMI